MSQRPRRYVCSCVRPAIQDLERSRLLVLSCPPQTHEHATMSLEVIDAQVSPTGRLEVISRSEAEKLLDRSHGGLHELFRNCSLAVLNCGNELDDGKELLERYPDFDIQIINRARGIKLDITAAFEK